MEVVIQNITDEKWDRAQQEAKAQGINISSPDGVIVNGKISVKYRREGTTLTLDIKKPWYIPEIAVREFLKRTLVALEK